MKVTVCFGNIRVVVPCGSGDLTVGELQEKACARYRKAIAKPPSYRVQINQLESSVDSGILDSDDFVCDVVEDKEKLIAIFEEETLHKDAFYDQNIPLQYPNSTGDSKQKHSAFQNGELSRILHRKEPSLEVDVNSEALRSNTRVMVRNENGFLNTAPYENAKSSKQSIPMSSNGGIYDPRSYAPISHKVALKSKSSSESSKSDNRSNNRQRTNLNETNHFRRDLATRQSMGSGLSETVGDFPMAYSIVIDDELPSPELRKRNSEKFNSNLPWFYRDSQEVFISNEGDVEAVKVAGFIDRLSGKFAGLLIQSVAKNSRIATDDLLMPGDVIVEINEHMLMDFAFEDAEAMLIESLSFPEVQFRILPIEERERRTSAGSSSSAACPSVNFSASNSSHSATSTSKSNQIDSTSASSLSTQQSQSPSSKPTITQLSADHVSKYTKKIGRKVNVQLKKDIQGLGFTLTSRDTTIGGPGPIYIKQILPTGAAIKSGKLQPGDRLLDVNGESVIGKSQDEVVSTLRAVTIGSVVSITLSRQNEDLPRKLDDDPASDQIVNDDNLKEYFVFEIPLNDTGSAGLGISLKGNQSTKTGKDMGIFVRAVLRGGAAWQDGRLQPNDQLIEVNGHSLRSLPNRAAIDVLTNSMVTEGNIRGLIEMVIARRRKTSDESTSQVSSEASGDMSDVIFDQFQSERAMETSDKQPLKIMINDEVMVSDDVTSPKIVAPAAETDSGPLDEIKNPDVVLYDDEEEPLDAAYEPFSRESTLRQSISEKRKDPVPRLPNQNESDRREKKEKKSHKRDSEKETKMNGKMVPLSKHGKHTALLLSTTQNNNNNSTSYAWKVPEHRKMRKSASSESLLKAGINENCDLGRNPSVAHADANVVDVGPSLGMAKSSSLESLQTAEEKCKQSRSQLPTPRPLTKVVRGRVLNDSFRAALDQSYDVTKEPIALHHLAILQENDSPSSVDSTKSLKKRTKLFGLFKGNKLKKSDDDDVSYAKLTESEMHKLNLEAKREKDFEKMKAENERISVKAKEFRQKQSAAHHKDKTKHDSSVPPVPSTQYRTFEDFYSKTKNGEAARHSNHVTSTSSSEHHARHKSETITVEAGRGGSVPPPVPKHHRRNKTEKFREANAAYNSLPRPPKRESSEVSSSSVLQITSAGDRNSFKKMDNLAFYNRHKPSSVKKHSSDSTIHSKTDANTNSLPENITRNPASTVKRRDRPGRTERRASNDAFSHSTSTPSFYEREASPVVPPQSFYVVQEKKDSPGTVVVRKGVLSKNSFQQTPPSSYRHSIFTDQPSTYRYQASSRTSPRASPGKNHSLTPRPNNESLSWIRLTPENDSESGSTDDNNRSMSTPDSEVAERNRKAYLKLMQGYNGELLGSIEVTPPYNL